MVIRGCPTSQGGQPGFPISTLPYTTHYTGHQTANSTHIAGTLPIYYIPAYVYIDLPTYLPKQSHTYLSNRKHTTNSIVPLFSADFPTLSSSFTFLHFSYDSWSAQSWGKKKGKKVSHDSNGRKQRGFSPGLELGPE